MKKPENQIELLNDAMVLLENRRSKECEELKHRFYEISKNFRPANIFNQTVKDFGELSEVETNLFETLLSIAGVYFSKEIILGKSNSLMKKISGYTLQDAITNFILKKIHADIH